MPGDRPVSFALHIQGMFTDGQRTCMAAYFDLSSYDDVKANADNILAAVSDHSMPADASGPWPNEWIQIFARWKAEGCAA